LNPLNSMIRESQDLVNAMLRHIGYETLDPEIKSDLCTMVQLKLSRLVTKTYAPHAKGTPLPGLARAIEDAGFSIQSLAKHSGMAHGQISGYAFRGQRASDKSIERLCAALGCVKDVLLDDD